MPTTSFSMTTAGISQYAPLGTWGGAATDVTSQGFIFTAIGTDCSIRFKNVTSNAPFWAQFRVDGGAWQTLTGFNYPASGGVVIFAALSDSDHVVEAMLTTIPGYNFFAIDNITPPISVTGAAPAIKYAPGFGATVTALDVVSTLPASAQKWQFGGGVFNGSNTPWYIPQSSTYAPIFIRVPNPGTVTAVTVRAASTGTSVTAEVYHKPSPTLSARFVGLASTTIAATTLTNLTVSCSPPLVGGNIIVIVGLAASVQALSLVGISGALPLLGSNVWPDACVSGTSLTVTPSAGTHTPYSPATYPAILCAGLGYMPWNYGVGSSNLITDFGGLPCGITQEPLLESRPFALWIEAHAQNEQETAAAFRTALTAHIGRVLAAQQSTNSVAMKVLVLGLETPNNQGGTDPTRRAAFLGTMAAPGAAILSVNDTNTAIGAGRAFYLDSAPGNAALLSIAGGWSDDNVHPNSQAAASAIAAGLFPQAATALGIVSATSFTVTGSTSGIVGTASSPFTLTPAGSNYTGTITPADGGAGGTFIPTVLTWTGDMSAKTFTYTPSTAGRKTITITSSLPTITIPFTAITALPINPIAPHYPSSMGHPLPLVNDNVASGYTDRDRVVGTVGWGGIYPTDNTAGTDYRGVSAITGLPLAITTPAYSSGNFHTSVIGDLSLALSALVNAISALNSAESALLTLAERAEFSEGKSEPIRRLQEKSLEMTRELNCFLGKTDALGLYNGGSTNTNVVPAVPAFITALPKSPYPTDLVRN